MSLEKLKEQAEELKKINIEEIPSMFPEQIKKLKDYLENIIDMSEQNLNTILDINEETIHNKEG